MMAIQTTIIRVGGLSFGSSQFTFSMVVAVFVLCIALGSFGVSLLSQIPTRLVVINQWAIGLVLWLLYTQVDKAPYLIQTLRAAVQDNPGAFVLYYASGFGLVLVAIGLPVVLSGAALPLLFHHMRRQVDHLGDLAGNLYSWNTVGSLLGALLGGYVLLYWLDLHQVYRVAVAALLAAAVLLCVRVHDWRPAMAISVMAALLLALWAMPAWNPQLLYAGLFRTRDVLPGQFEGVARFVALNPGHFSAPFESIEDDPIASITVRRYPAGVDGRTSLTIATNGKSDGNSVTDYPTMGLAATLPALLAEKAENAFVIGWGTGITVAELAALTSVKRIEVAELSPGVMRAAPLFDRVTRHASKNPKVEVIRSDAYRALMRSQGKFDLIISEPSNPWVTGVEMLFSREFLAAARSKLTQGGVYCQWMHQYETDAASLELVLRTYAATFDHIAIWGTKYSDLLLLGFNDPGSATDVYRLQERFDAADFRASFERAGVASFPELLAHELVPLGVVHKMEFEGPLHSLYHPRLSHRAGLAFFKGERADIPFTGFGAAGKTGARSSLIRRYALRFRGRLPDETRAKVILKTCEVHAHRCQTLLAQWIAKPSDSATFRQTYETIATRVEDAERHDHSGRRADRSAMQLMSTMIDTAPTAPSERHPVEFDVAKRANALFVDFYHHAAPFAGDALLDLWSRCVESSPSPQACRERLGLVASGKLADADRARIRECRRERSPGPRCRAGAEAARALVERGIHPTTLTRP